MKKLILLVLLLSSTAYAWGPQLYYPTDSDNSLGKILLRDAVNNVSWAILTKPQSQPPTHNTYIYVPPKNGNTNSAVNHAQFSCHYCGSKQNQCDLVKNLECCECLQKYFESGNVSFK